MTLKELLKRHESDVCLESILQKLERLCSLEYEFRLPFSFLKNDIKKDIGARTTSETKDEDPNIYEYEDLIKYIFDVEDALEALSEKINLLFGLIRDQERCLKPMMEEYKERTKNISDILINMLSEENDEQ